MLRIHNVAIQVVGEISVLMREIERFDPDLARQGRRAMVSVPLNVAEGSDQVGKRRANHYRFALGSARETRSVLECAVAAGYIAPPSLALIEKMKHVIGTLTKCIKSAETE